MIMTEDIIPIVLSYGDTSTRLFLCSLFVWVFHFSVMAFVKWSSISWQLNIVKWYCEVDLFLKFDWSSIFSPIGCDKFVVKKKKKILQCAETEMISLTQIWNPCSMYVGLKFLFALHDNKNMKLQAA